MTQLTEMMFDNDQLMDSLISVCEEYVESTDCTDYELIAYRCTPRLVEMITTQLKVANLSN